LFRSTCDFEQRITQTFVCNTKSERSVEYIIHDKSTLSERQENNKAEYPQKKKKLQVYVYHHRLRQMERPFV
jgi:hypothetical protein